MPGASFVYVVEVIKRSKKAAKLELSNGAEDWFPFKMCPGLSTRAVGDGAFLQCIPDWILKSKHMHDLISHQDVNFEREKEKWEGKSKDDILEGPDDLNDAYRKLHLRPSAPPEVVKAAYKQLALLHHPDRGGDTALLAQINAAYQRITGG